MRESQLLKGMTNDCDLFTTNFPECKVLYLDYSCLVDYVLQKTDLSGVAESEIEETIVRNILVYTRRLSNEIIKPTELLFIAMDGPVPNTKLCKQRERRFKKQFDEHIEHGLGLPKPPFNSNAITPGTVFMQKLHERILGMIELKSFHVTVRFSSSNEAGEGEFKIFSHIRETNCPMIDRQIVVYGTDPIASCMVNGLDIKLCREDETGQIVFLDTFSCLTQLMEKHSLLRKFEQNPRKILLELVLLFMFGGNDFVFSFHFTKVCDDGIQVLLREFSRGNYTLVDTNDRINWTEVQTLLSNVATREPTPISDQIKKLNKHDLSSDIKFYQYGALSDQRHVMHDAFKRQEIVSLQFWKPEYYQNVLRIDYDKVNVDAVCDDYLNSIKWCWDYYVYGIVPSWTYCYKYIAAPPMSDLVTRMSAPSSSTYTLDEFRGQPPSTFAQLLTVLPRTSGSLLPSCFLNLITNPSSIISRQYPCDETKLEFELSSNQMICATPILPPYDLALNQRLVYGLGSSFASGEHERNNLK